MYVDNEISELQKVIVHFPDDGISRISPKRAEGLLFDDIVFYPLMAKEYKAFLQLLTSFVGANNVFQIERLIRESIEASDSIKEEVIDRVIEFEQLPLSFEKYFSNLSSADLAKTLITGYLKAEDRILFDPIPNYMFTRDIAVTIKDHILITRAAKEARFRENLLSRFIFFRHPMFSDLVTEGRLIDLNDREKFPPSQRGEVVNAEGGDIMMFTEDYVLIGASERTTPYAFNCIRDALFEKDLVKHVVQVTIPDERSFMHIDTLFTMIDDGLVACHKPIVYDGEGSNVIVHSQDGLNEMFPSIKEFLISKVNPEMKFVFSGGGISPYQEREQWTDSCNLVAIRPGVAISYDRNLRTLEEFRAVGYHIMDAEDVFQQLSMDDAYTSRLQKTIITIPSAELSRARGGSHCMTCPILRSA
ncbi:MAG: arginine deiminase family protein [Bacteroidota bacterium]